MIEGAFVDTAIVIFAFATARAARIDVQRRLIAVLDALASEQVAYFERVCAARGIAGQKDLVEQPGVVAFCKGMHDIAETGGYADIVTAMFATERMYWTWCLDVVRVHVADPHLRDWISLHTAPDFESRARWLQAEVDRAGEALSEDEGRRTGRPGPV